MRFQHWPEACNDPDDLKEMSPTISEPEKHLKRLLPTFTGMDHMEVGSVKEESIDEIVGRSAGGILDYKEALYFGDSAYAELTKYYLSLERIMSMEWFLIQL